MELAANVDVMLVVGGRNSANTTKLAKLCESKCKTYHIETAEEILPEWFNQCKKIGITAGASTPDWIIREVSIKCQMM
jgi:4-hydroxy-3-methylbut-2-enyl diphosphate reductase